MGGRGVTQNTAKTATPLLGSGEYYGGRSAERLVTGFHLTESAYPPGCDIPEHSHENAFFSFVISGTSREESGSGRYERIPGMLIFHPERQRHANHWDVHGGSCLHVELAPSRLEEIRRQGLPLREPSILARLSNDRLGANLLSEFHRNDFASAVAIEGVVLELLSEIAREGRESVTERRSPPWLREARELVDRHYVEGLGVGDLARRLGVNASHLAVSFRRVYGCSVGDYLRSRRISAACSLLSDSDLPIGEIALLCGFADQPHFSKVFRSITGQSPKHYRIGRRSTDKQ